MDGLSSYRQLITHLLQLVIMEMNLHVHVRSWYSEGIGEGSRITHLKYNHVLDTIIE